MADTNRKAIMAPGEQERIDQALAALAKDTHSPREISVKYILHVHNEFPKHVKVGEDKDGNAITKVVQNPAEESAALAAAKSEEPTVQ